MVTPILQSVVVVESDSADGCTEGNILGSTRGFAVDGVSSIRAIVRPAAFSSNQPFSFSMVTLLYGDQSKHVRAFSSPLSGDVGGGGLHPDSLSAVWHEELRSLNYHVLSGMGNRNSVPCTVLGAVSPARYDLQFEHL